MMLRIPLYSLYQAHPEILDFWAVYDTNPELWDFAKGKHHGIDFEIVRGNILSKYGEMTPEPSDPAFLTEKFRRWVAANMAIWQQLNNTLYYEYDPISNYDRHEEWTDTATGTASASDTNTDQVQGFDSATWEDRQKTGGESKQNTSGTSTHTAHISGNIGVTTTQEMIQSERDVLRYNLYDTIADDYADNFLIQLY